MATEFASTPANFLKQYPPTPPAKDDVLHLEGNLTRDDGSVLHYRIDGSPSPQSPIIVFVNEILVNLQLWDPVVERMSRQHPSHRVIRYDIRGYTPESLGGDRQVTLGLLASDLHALLVHLNIPRIHSVVGLGLGASIALTYIANADFFSVIPVSSFVGVGFPLPLSPSMPERHIKEKWDAREILAGRVGMDITGDKAVARWFSADARDTEEWRRVREIVVRGNREGMTRTAAAVVESVSSHGGKSPDLRSSLESLNVPALFLCGAGDNVFPEEMAEYPGLMKSGLGEFKVIDRAARLVPFEQVDSFVRLLSDWWEQRLFGHSK